jgi:MFS transporter, SP family, sugar:H+ symporter
VYFFVYETKGLTLEQVDSMYAEVGNAWRSSGWKPQITFKEEVRRKSMAEGVEGADNVEKYHQVGVKEIKGNLDA